jgi:tetratricopeptide (TPR) repeat protein/predicted Ser/Thr protein kinase
VEEIPSGAAGKDGATATETAIRLPGWERQVFARGAVLGRYFVLDPLGSGGSGVVYAAYDPELDRKIALKLLRAERAGDDARARLLREAQAMARLSHPNVLAVHDVGTFGDQVFVAMELVDGWNLRQWLAAEPRTRSRILEVFAAAGRGLAAAHAAGFVHRDFKPENVLVGRDGRVRVADFGLVRSEGDADLGTEGSAPASASPAAVTLPGTIPGTPGYMAPEQLAGRPADFRSDQFAFCVSLYQALYGRRPFAPGSWTVEEPPSGARVPARLRRLLLRGLAVDPAARFSSMDELLAGLERDPSAARRRWAAMLAAVALLGAVLLGAGWLLRERAQLCEGAEERLAGVWDPARKEAVRKAFLATGVPFAPQAFREVERALDSYAGRWTAMRTDACAATRKRGEQSEAALDLRMACLDRALQEVGALSGLLARADRTVVGTAGEAASRLPALSVCSDVESLRARVRPPRDPAVAKRVAAAQSRLAGLKALVAAGKYKEGFPQAVALQAEARSLGYPPLEAEVLQALGQLQDLMGDPKAAERTLFEALSASEAGRNDEAAVDAGTRLVWVVSESQRRPAEGLRWADFTRAKLQGMGGNAEKEGWLLHAQATALADEGRNDEAGSVLRTARARLVEALGADHPALSRIDMALGAIPLYEGRFREAEPRYRQLLAKLVKSYGPDHPFVAVGWNNLCVADEKLGRLEEAERDCRRALEIRDRFLGPESFDTAASLLNLAILRVLQGRPAEALPMFRRVRAIHERSLGPGNPYLEYALTGEAQALAALHRYAESIVVCDRIIAFRAAKPDPLGVEGIRYFKGQALWEMGRREEGLALVRQAREALAQLGKPAAPLVAEIDGWLAEVRRPSRGA